MTRSVKPWQIKVLNTSVQSGIWLDLNKYKVFLKMHALMDPYWNTNFVSNLNKRFYFQLYRDPLHFHGNRKFYFNTFNTKNVSNVYGPRIEIFKNSIFGKQALVTTMCRRQNENMVQISKSHYCVFNIVDS